MQTFSAFFGGASGQPLEFLQKLAASKKPKEELANDALSLALIAGVEYAQGPLFSTALNPYTNTSISFGDCHQLLHGRRQRGTQTEYRCCG